MINSVLSIKCEDCNGYGYLFYGDENDYDVESCSCQENPALFLSKENE